MKKLLSIVAILGIITISINAQVELKNIDLNKTYVIKTHDGATFVGKIISHDQHEALILTLKLGEIAVPTYQLKEISEAEAGDVGSKGEYLKDNLFATRYFITTNGLPIKKGEAYALINWYGPDIQYGLADNLSVGIMTSWIGTPVIGSIKYSMQLDDNLSLGLGALVGSMGWTSITTGGALPYAAMTYGNRKSNITFSAGYGAVWFDDFDGYTVDGEALMSVAGMTRISNSLSLVFDSFILPGLSESTPATALIIPGIRFQRKENFALQLGLTGIYSSDMNYDGSGGFAPIALPMFQVYWKF